MVEDPARSLADALADTGTRLNRTDRGVGLLVLGDQAQRLVRGIDQLDRADDDALERVPPPAASPTAPAASFAGCESRS